MDVERGGSDTEPMQPYMVHEVAELIRVSPNAVYLMIARNELPHVRFGRSIRLPRGPINKKLCGVAA